jgi:hypothetical protein
MRTASRTLRRFAFALLVVASGIACGSRTGLFIDDSSVALGPDASGRGIGVAPDGSSLDASTSDAVSTLDVNIPGNVDRTDCPDADALLIYTITEAYSLQSFNPATGQFKNIGRIACPVPDPSDTTDTPFSMAVDRKGAAYILFRDQNLYRVSTATGACIATPYVSGQSNFKLFGMGFATNSIGPTETLYVAGSQLDLDRTGARGIAKIDPDTFKLTVVTDFPTVEEAELTGTGDGRLYAFYENAPGNGRQSGDPPSFIGQLDTSTGNIIGERRFDTIGQGHAWAFAFWGGDFYMFTEAEEQGPSNVTRWRPSDDSVAVVATNPEGIVGAGVSTCAPQQ